jgi:hypothetical protein
VNERVRSVLLGLAVAIGPLLLIDLAQTLRQGVFESGESTNIWWMLACYAGVGAIAAFGVAASRRDRVVPAVALMVMLLAVLPTVPSNAVAWMRSLPLVGGPLQVQGSLAVGAALAGAYAYALVRGPRT